MSPTSLTKIPIPSLNWTQQKLNYPLFLETNLELFDYNDSKIASKHFWIQNSLPTIFELLKMEQIIQYRVSTYFGLYLPTSDLLAR